MLAKPSFTSEIVEAVEALDARLQRGPPFTTTSAIIDALGGLHCVAAITGSKVSAVGNWQKFKHFPPRFYTVMLAALHERGLHAPASLWGMATGQEQDEAADSEVA